MAENASSVANATNGTLGSITNSTETGPQTFMATVAAEAEMIFIALQVITSAVSIIWFGAHTSLRRPPSAAPVQKLGKDGKRVKDDEFVEGFVASDAIMFPMMAAVTLIGLYYLIKWLQDPELLNKILRVYMSVMAFACLGKLSSDAFCLFDSFIFPSKWASWDGTLYHVDDQERKVFTVDLHTGAKTLVPGRQTPLPGFLGLVFPARMNNLLWETRHLVMEDWTLRLSVLGFGTLKTDININAILGGLAAICGSFAYFMTGWVSLSNLLGTAFSYSSFAIMSPTSFNIGTMVLAGLFVYDIVMVFYT
jgi:minor histocompatibility antigen H13